MSCSTCPAKEIINNIPTENTTNTTAGCGKLSTFDWLKDLPANNTESSLVEVQFKNTRKGFYLNTSQIRIKRGDYIAVEADKGHDIGQVALTGKLADLQLKKKKPKYPPEKKIYRKANKTDIEKWTKARLREKTVLIKSRQLADSLQLDMKISDVEFQGDGSRATFYYIADGRVDFRELIKLYAKEFSIRIEMKQIGSRQEAALVGGIGSCGKELCCSSWRTNLTTVIANAARIQSLPHNAQKLTGQCGKLKCCLMYELDTYLEAQSEFPDLLLELETDMGIAYPKKKDLLKKTIQYAVGEEKPTTLIEVPLERVKEIIQLNKKGIKVNKLVVDSSEDLGFVSHVGEELPAPKQSFKKNKNKKRNKNRRNMSH